VVEDDDDEGSDVVEDDDDEGSDVVEGDDEDGSDVVVAPYTDATRATIARARTIWDRIFSSVYHSLQPKTVQTPTSTRIFIANILNVVVQ